MITLTGYGFFLLNVGLAALVLHALVRPLAGALAGRRWAWRPQASDWVALALVLLLPTGLGLWQYGNEKQPLRWQVATLAAVVVLFWWRGVGALSQLHIRHSARRLVLLCVLIPLSLFGSLLLVIGVIRLHMELVLQDQHSLTEYVWFALVPFTTLAIFFIRRVLRWVLAGAEPLPASEANVILAERVRPRDSEPAPLHE